MKKYGKQILILGLAVCIFAFAGCASDTPAPTPEPEEPAATETPAPEPESAIPGLPLATATFIPGTFTATAPSYNENPLTVEVSFSENQITNVAVIEHGDSMYGSGWFWRAYPGVPDQILVMQSTQGIDAFTGATITRTAIIEAVEDTITQAGAAPADLVPQSIDAPLPGDMFIPGFHVITVPVNTMDFEGNPLPEDEAEAEAEGVIRMLYSEDTDMTLRVSFGRNEMHVHTGGAFGLGQGEAGHGESIYPDEIQGGTWGSWWFRQVAHHQINDRQSTHVDVQTGATMSASGIVWGVEQAIRAAGADPSTITPRSYPLTQIQRNPGNPEARFFVPGHYTVTVEGFGGDMTITVTLDRSNIRRILVRDHNETESHWDLIWPYLRDLIYEEQTTNVDIDAFTGATVSTNAIIEAVREAMAMAGETNPANW